MTLNTQLDLFSPQPSQSTDPLDALLGEKADNFRYWCRYGNREMCAAVLVNAYQMDRTKAKALVHAAAHS